MFLGQDMSPWSTWQSVGPAHCTIVKLSLGAFFGHSYLIGGGGLHVRVGLPASGLGQSTLGRARHAPPDLLTNQRCSYGNFSGAGGLVFAGASHGSGTAGAPVFVGGGAGVAGSVDGAVATGPLGAGCGGPGGLLVCCAGPQ